MSINKGYCEVCGKDDVEGAVYSGPGPISLFHCTDCFGKDPLWVWIGYVAGAKYEDLVPAAQESIKEALDREGKTIEWFNEESAKFEKSFNEEMDKWAKENT